MNLFITSLKPAGTISFRLAASKVLNTYGGNGQNITKSSLDIFDAGSGHVFVQSDQSGAEALVFAHMAKPGRYRSLFLAGIKSHTWIAWRRWPEQFKSNFTPDSLDPFAVKADPRWAALAKEIADSYPWYDLAKRTCHAYSYRMRARTFKDNVLKTTCGAIRLTMTDAAACLDAMSQEFPELPELQNEIEAKIRTTRILHNLFGFPRHFDRTITDGYIRDGISWIPQSTVACITHHCIDATMSHIHSNRLPWQVVSNKHDSITTRVPIADAAACAAFQEAAMAQTLTGRDSVQFTMKSETQIGRNLGKSGPKNPHGLITFKPSL